MGRGKNFQPDSVSAREASATAAPETHVPSPSGPCPFNASTDTIVQEFGPCIPGEHKWLGAAVAEDGSIWGVPSNNRRVVKVVPGTGEVTTHGEALGTREYKYLRGIRTHDELMVLKTTRTLKIHVTIAVCMNSLQFETTLRRPPC